MHFADSVQVHARPLLKLTTDFCVSTSKSPSAQTQPQWPCLAPLRVQATRPLTQVLDSEDTKWLDWLDEEKHNYGHPLPGDLPRNSALLVVKATLKDRAYSVDFVPPEAFHILASYLLSWAAPIASLCSQLSNCLWRRPVVMVPQAARILSRKQRGDDLTFATARQLEGCCGKR